MLSVLGPELIGQAGDGAPEFRALAVADNLRAHATSIPRSLRDPRHRDLRGTSTASGPSAVRTRRSRPFPHPPSTPPHDGHASPPPASRRSTSSRSPFTVSTTPPRVTLWGARSLPGL